MLQEGKGFLCTVYREVNGIPVDSDVLGERVSLEQLKDLVYLFRLDLYDLIEFKVVLYALGRIISNQLTFPDEADLVASFGLLHVVCGDKRVMPEPARS